jgi:hypothetical protein
VSDLVITRAVTLAELHSRQAALALLPPSAKSKRAVLAAEIKDLERELTAIEQEASA